MADGYIGKCKTCNKSDVIANRLKRLEYYRDYDRRRSKEPHRVAFDLARHRENPKYKTDAWSAVARAIKSGDLIRPDLCEHCRVVCKPDGHHDDHEKQLEVMWLCRICHAARHVELGRLSNA